MTTANKRRTLPILLDPNPNKSSGSRMMEVSSFYEDAITTNTDATPVTAKHLPNIL
jgi:hypothetical protein